MVASSSMLRRLKLAEFSSVTSIASSSISLDLAPLKGGIGLIISFPMFCDFSSLTLVVSFSSIVLCSPSEDGIEIPIFLIRLGDSSLVDLSSSTSSITLLGFIVILGFGTTFFLVGLSVYFG